MQLITHLQIDLIKARTDLGSLGIQHDGYWILESLVQITNTTNHFPVSIMICVREVESGDVHAGLL